MGNKRAQARLEGKDDTIWNGESPRERVERLNASAKGSNIQNFKPEPADDFYTQFTAMAAASRGADPFMEARYERMGFEQPSPRDDKLASAMFELAKQISTQNAVMAGLVQEAYKSNAAVGEILDAYRTDIKVAELKASTWEKRYRDLEAESASKPRRWWSS